MRNAGTVDWSGSAVLYVGNEGVPVGREVVVPGLTEVGWEVPWAPQAPGRYEVRLLMGTKVFGLGEVAVEAAARPQGWNALRIAGGSVLVGGLVVIAVGLVVVVLRGIWEAA